MIIETMEQCMSNLALARAENDRLRAEVARLKERLEIGYQFDSEGNRVECEDDGYDGIFCRDQTIKLQDEEIDRLRAELAEARKLIEQCFDDNYDSGCFRPGTAKAIDDWLETAKEGE